MDELGTTPEVTPTSEETYINSDGTYKEGWKDALLPEELRTEKFYDSPFNANVKELLKTAGNQAKMLGKKGVIPLSDKSSETEVIEWRKAHGVPDSYKYQVPEDLKIDEEGDFISKNLDEINKRNISQGQLDYIAELYQNEIRSKNQEHDNWIVQQQNMSNQEILKREGMTYEENQQNIDKIVRLGTQGWSDEDIQMLFPTPNSEKEYITNIEDNYFKTKSLQRMFLANIGKLIGEHRMVQGETGGKSIQTQIDEIMHSPEYQTGYGKLHQEAVDKLIKLREMMKK